MKNQKMKETLRQISKKAGALVLATAIVLGGGTYVYNQQNPVPELVTYVDEDSVVQIQEDKTPLRITTGNKVHKNDKVYKEDFAEIGIIQDVYTERKDDNKEENDKDKERKKNSHNQYCNSNEHHKQL